MKQNVRKQSEDATSTNEVCERQNSKFENENQSQIQKFDIITSNEHTRQRKSIIRVQSSTASASFKKLKRNRMNNNVEKFNNKR